MVFKKKGLVPIAKVKKHLTVLLFFYQLEKILKVQVFFKFKNICTNLVDGSVVAPAAIVKVYNHLTLKFSSFRFQFSEGIYLNTIMFFLNLFKFKNPDGLLLSNYISLILSLIQKHNQFLVFIKRIVQVLKKLFRFRGIRIQVSGKLNGFSRAQTKQIQVGNVSLQSFTTSYVEGFSRAFTNTGKVGIKV
jgi:hypothetical protein